MISCKIQYKMCNINLENKHVRLPISNLVLIWWTSTLFIKQMTAVDDHKII